MVLPILVALIFLGFAYAIRKNAWMAVPLLIGAALLALTASIKVHDSEKIQAKHDVDTLLDLLGDRSLWQENIVEGKEARLLLASTSAQALYRARRWYPERRGAIDSTLTELAQWATLVENFPEWRRRSSWDERMFFLAHAGKILAYDALSNEADRYSAELSWIGEHLGNRLVRARYKHLPSRPDEAYFRPADNAAALHTLRLYDQVKGTNLFGPTFADWNAYTTDELYYAESRLPCAAFSATNTCQLEPSAAATGMYIAYRAAALPSLDTDIPYREWLHYFKGNINTPWTLRIRRDMRKGAQTKFCDAGTQPLKCGRYEEEIGLWAAAEYGGGYTYFRLFSNVLLRRWLHGDPAYSDLSSAKKLESLQAVAFRALGETL